MTPTPEQLSTSRLIAEQRADQPDMVRLAQSLSLAAQAEAHFVRGARLRFLPHSSTGLEARLWFSPFVEAADSRTLVLAPAVASALRRELAAGSRALLDSVHDFTEQAHSDAPLAVRAFESLLWTATLDAVPAESRVRQVLAPFLSHVLAGGDMASEASRWAMRYLPRLPASIRDSPPARRLRIVAAERLGLEFEPAPGADTQETRTARRLVHGDIDIGVRPDADGVALSRPPERDAMVCQVSGAARARLRVRAALPGAAWHDLDLHDRRRAALRLDVFAAARLDGTVDSVRAEPGDAVRCAWSGQHGALALTTAGRTEVRVDTGAEVFVTELPVGPELLTVADSGPARAAASDSSGLRVVTGALDGSGEVASHRWVPSPTGLGWSAVAGPGGPRTVLCVADGPRVHGLEEGDLGRVLLRLVYKADVVCLWSSVRAAALAVADADGRVLAHRAAPDGGMSEQQLAGPGPRVTALSGDPSTGAVAWATEDGFVRLCSGGAGAVTLGRLARPATSLALSPSADTVTAADGGRHVYRLPWPSAGSTRPHAEPSRTTRLPFLVREVFAVHDDRLILAGSGGPLEIRSEDGRVHLILPDPAATPPPAPGPPWLSGSTGVALPPHSAEAPSVDLLRMARRSGVGHLFLPPPLLEGAEALAATVRRAHDAGVRLIADLPEPSPGRTSDLLACAHHLLDARLDGLRVRNPGRTEGLLSDLRHLVDAYPEAALIAIARPVNGAGPSSTPDPDRTAHLWLDPPPDPRVPALPRAPGRAWALPDGPFLRSRQLLALPGCQEISWELLTSADPQEVALRGLLAARSRQSALVHGDVDPASLSMPAPGVTAVWRRYGSESVLCLTNGSGAELTVRARARPDEPELVEIAACRPAPPSRPAGAEPRRPLTVRAVDGDYAIRVGPHQTRWLNAWDPTANAPRPTVP